MSNARYFRVTVECFETQTSLDTLQAEDQCFMGILLPTISSLRSRLTSVKETLKVARPFADALLNGLNKRFGAYESQND